MLGSAPIAARVGGYVVVPGARGPERENFVVLKYLIDELYSSHGGGVYDDSFPDIGALRDAARISIEAAGAVRLLSDYSDLKWLLVHGALVNPVSRYTDVMQEGRVRHRFPDFSKSALAELLPGANFTGRDRDHNFISVHRRQLQFLEATETVVCGVIERESTTTSVCRAVLDSLPDDIIRDLLPEPPGEWKRWFRNAVDPSDDDDFEGQRITDSLLFRCVLEPGEALVPIDINRNDLRKAPQAWSQVISLYPTPRVTYLQVSGALEELIAVGSKDDKADPASAEELVVAMGGIEGEILMRPDDRGLPVTIYPDRDSNTCFILSISDPERVLSIRLDPAKTKIVGLWIRPSSLTDFTWDLNRQVASLERPLRILSRPFDEVTSIEKYIKERGLFSEIARRHAASKFYKPSVAPAKVTDGVGIKEEVDAIESDVMSVPLSDLWEALLDAEATGSRRVPTNARRENRSRNRTRRPKPKISEPQSEIGEPRFPKPLL